MLCCQDLSTLLPSPMNGWYAAMCAHNSSKNLRFCQNPNPTGVALQTRLSAATILPCCFVSYVDTAPTADSYASRYREHCWWDYYLSLLVGTNAEIGENCDNRLSEIAFTEVEYFTVL